MTQQLTVKLAGLYTFQNDLSAVPEGALAQADNVIIDRDGEAEPRRGFDYLRHGGVQSAFSSSTYRAARLFFYQGKTLCHYGTSGSPSFFAYHDSSSGWTNYTGSFAPPSVTVPMRAAQANQNFYFTTSTGVQKLDSATGTPTSIGVPPGLDVTATVAASASAWMATATASAYRIVWGIKDGNQNLILGAPSQRSVVINSSGSTKAVSVDFSIPSGITTAHFYQIYRSPNVGSAITPSDELQLVYEANPSSGDITSKTITVTDIVPDTLLGATIYTAPSQEGPAAANEPAPLAADVTVFKNVLFFANTSSLQGYNLTLLGIGSPNGLVATDTLTIGGITYTGAASEDATIGQFKVSTGGSASQNIADTALSLVKVINRYASSTVYAYYESGINDLPGQMLFQARTVGAASFPVTSSRSTCWNPALPSSGTTQSSTNDSLKNAVFYSKVSEPEHVPLGNNVLVGSADSAILRVIALRDSLFILKEDGIYRLYGSDPSNFQVSPLDYTAIVIAPDSAVALNNQIYALTTQGVVAIGEQGVQIMSHPIEDQLTALSAANYSLLQTSSFGVAYESSRAYYLFCMSNAADTKPTQWFRYNYITNAWTRGTLSKLCGGVNPADDKLYLGNAGLNIVDVERKSLTYSDYADYQSTQTITAVTGAVVKISAADTITVGSIIFQSSTVFGTVVSVDISAGTATTSLPVAFSNGSADVLAPISTAITWIPVTLANPGLSKQVREASVLFKSDFNGTAMVGFASDVNPGVLTETILGGNVGGWGEFGWGGPTETSLGVPWGGDPRRRPIRIAVPRNHQRSSLLTVSFTHAYGFSPWIIQGISLVGNAISERVAQ